jgi:hypothetical protein
VHGIRNATPPTGSKGGAGSTNTQSTYNHRITNVGVAHNRAWRWRCCPSCKSVERASDFKVVGGYRPGWDQHGTMRRSCPNCGHVGPTGTFQVVREARR